MTVTPEPPGGRPEPPDPDPRIPRLALQLAELRPGLTDRQRLYLARDLAARVRNYGQDPYTT